MSMKKPKIRFKGYTEDWEQRKVGDIATITTGGTPSTKEISYWEPKEIPWLASGEVHKKYVYETDEMISEEGLKSSSAKWIEKGSVLIALAGQGKTRGTAAITRVPITTNQSIASIKFNNILDADYAFHNLDNRYEELRNISSGDGTRGGLNKQLLLDLEIMFPKIDEQIRIGEYFTNLDHLITLHQRKCNQAEKLKKYMLQKMFPQNGEKNPEIRFDGFTDDWEQRKLGKNIVEYTEKTTENNQYPVLTSSRKGIFFQKDYYDGNQIASADNTGYNIVPYGYFTYRHMSDDEIFHFNINDIAENGIVSTLYPVFTTDENLDSRYLQYQLNYGREFAKYAILQKQGGSRTYMYLNKLRNLYITVPTTIQEQKKVSEYFTSLDHLITLHQHK